MTKNVTHLCALEGMLLNLIPTIDLFKKLSPKFKNPLKIMWGRQRFGLRGEFGNPYGNNY